LADLNAARASGSYHRILASILRCDLLILDDFGLQSIPLVSIQDLYEIICDRYETGSIIVTSNLAFEEWAEIFQNDLLSSAALDRSSPTSPFFNYPGGKLSPDFSQKGGN